eukprot:TRINITY_DN8172_c1_g1_i1.p1 TRINITY_DN8172_c1_g1~~TRINITY_DN8172_c1_g1_i1.p1  ORF type:complete len:152 (+),score=15.86 TRINITY_DN8172_c1_g1_i1:75-530(+)
MSTPTPATPSAGYTSTGSAPEQRRGSKERRSSKGPAATVNLAADEGATRSPEGAALRQSSRPRRPSISRSSVTKGSATGERRPSDGNTGTARQTSPRNGSKQGSAGEARRPSVGQLATRRPSLTRRPSTGTVCAGGGRRKYLMKKGSRDDL